MNKNPRYEARRYGELVDSDEDSTDLLRRCTAKYGAELVTSEDFIIEKEQEIQSGS